MARFSSDLLQEPRRELGLPGIPKDQGAPLVNLTKGAVVVGAGLVLLLLAMRTLVLRNAVFFEQIAAMAPVEVRLRRAEKRLRTTQ